MTKNFRPSSALILLLLALAFGATLRLMWPLDIEFKFDEAETFTYLRDWRRGLISFPWIGQHSSNGLRHPGLGIWIFMIAGKIFPVETIVDIARLPPVLSLLNFLVLALFARLALSERSRIFWYQALAVMAVNPFAIFLDRKLWHPSLLGIFVTGVFLSWLRRRSSLGSFFLGFFLLLPGQIHMSGFFLVLGFFLYEFYWERWNTFRTIRLPAFFAGLSLSVLPMLPWLYWLANGHGGGPPVELKLVRLVGFKFLNFWFTNAYAVLGTFPFGWISYRNPLYVAAIAILALVLLPGAWIFVLRVKRFLQRRQRSEQTRMEQFTFLGTGTVATLSLMHIPNYFTLCMGFVPFLSLVRSLALLKHGRTLLLVLIVAQAVASFTLLSYVHNTWSSPDEAYALFGKFGMPIRNCGKCEVGPVLERISGGTQQYKVK